MLLALQIDPSWMFAAGIALAAWLLLRTAYRRQKKSVMSANSPLSSTRRSSRLQFHRPLTDAPPEIVRWQVEMHDTARDLKAELDSKISVVQTLVGMAREEHRRLDEAIARAERLGLAESVEGPAEVVGRIERMAGSLNDADSSASRK